MGDLLFVAVVVAFFAVTVAYVKGCELIVGPDVPLPDEPLDGSPAAHRASGPGEGAAAVVAATGGTAPVRRDGDR